MGCVLKLGVEVGAEELVGFVVTVGDNVGRLEVDGAEVTVGESEGDSDGEYEGKSDGEVLLRYKKEEFKSNLVSKDN